MSKKRKNKVQQPKPDGVTNESNLPVKVEVEQIDKRVTNLEKVISTVKDISDAAFGVIDEYLKKKTESEQRQLEIENVQHKRAVYLLTFAIVVLFILCITALLQNQIDLVKFFINSGLAIAAGTGLSSLMKFDGKKKNKSN